MRPLGRPKHRWMDNIKMGLGEIEWSGMDRFDLAKDRNHWMALVNAVVNHRIV
jgi:hypothetical protein